MSAQSPLPLAPVLKPMVGEPPPPSPSGRDAPDRSRVAAVVATPTDGDGDEAGNGAPGPAYTRRVLNIVIGPMKMPGWGVQG